MEEEFRGPRLSWSSRHLPYGGLEGLNGSIGESVRSRMIRRRTDMTNGIPADEFLKLSTSEWRAISDTSISGKPCVAKITLSLSIVVCDVE